MYELRKQISVTAADYVAFNKNHHARKKTKLVPILIWASILLFTTLVYIAGLNSDTKYKYNSIPFFIFLFFFILALATAVAWGTYFLVRYIGIGVSILFYRASYEGRVRFKEAEITINDIGIEEIAPNIRSFAVWDQIVRIVEGKKAFYFYHTANAAYILPKRYIESLDELYHFKEFLKQVQIRSMATDYR